MLVKHLKMQCPNCGFDSPPGMKFCGMCGTQLTQVCPTCGFANPLDFKFCGQCGTSLSPLSKPVSLPRSPAQADALSFPAQRPASAVSLEGERRPVTVILVDVSGSTDLLERIGTERWVKIMNHVLQILESKVYHFGGQVDQFRGDGLVAFFGATSAHEDDPERAVLAALSMQEAIQPYANELREREDIELLLRVGVNSGEVIVASIGDSAQYSEDTAMGEAIALASRMETAASPGTILVSEYTYRLVQSQFEWLALGQILVKGMSQPIEVYRPLAPSTDAQRSQRLRAYGLPLLLVGRDREYELLTECISNLSTGRGGIVILRGDEGMGKSHLVDQVRHHAIRERVPSVKPGETSSAPTSGIVWLQGRCRSHEQSWPYSLWGDLLRNWLGLGQLGTDVETLDCLRGHVQALWDEHWVDYYPYLATLLSLPLEDEFAAQVGRWGAEGLRQKLFFSMRSWVEALSEQGPLVIAFEDVHWADASSLSLLEYCLLLCESKALYWFIMFRLDRDSAVWEFSHRVETAYPHRLTALDLAPLTEAQSKEMLDRLIGVRALPAEMRDLIVGKAEGNPYYIEEMVNSLIRDGVLLRDVQTGKWRTTQTVDSLDVPDTLRSLLLARVDALAAEDRHVLQMAAVIGSVFWENVLGVLVEDRASLASRLVNLQRAGLIQERGYVPDMGMEYLFKSTLIRDAAYEGILSAQRQVYHRQVADHLAQLFGEEVLAQYYGVVAYHYRCAGEHRKELFYTLSAAEYAQGIYANAEALARYRRALELLDALQAQDGAFSNGSLQTWRLESLRGLGQISFGMGQVAKAERYFRQAIAHGLELALPTRELVRLHYWLGEVLFWQNRYQEQISVAQQGLDLLGDDASSVEAALMNQEVAIAHYEQGDRKKFREFTCRTAQFLRQLSYAEELRPAYNHISKVCRVDKKIDQAIEWLQLLEQKAQQHQDLRALGEAHYLIGDILADKGDLRGAVEHVQQALDLFNSIGDTKHEGWCLGNAGWVSMMLGDLQMAESYARRGLEIARKVGNKRDIAWACWRVGQIALCQRAWDVAEQVFDQAAQLFRQVNRHRAAVRAIYALGQVYLARGEREKALERFHEAATTGEPETLRQDTFSLAVALHAIQEAYADRQAFRAFCQRFRDEHPELARSLLVQWFLEPATVPSDRGPGMRELIRDRFAEPLAAEWNWEDPFGDGSFRLEKGLEIHAASGRDLWIVNLGAPRMSRPVPQLRAGEGWVLETVCLPVSVDRLALGGLLLWIDRENYVRLDRGTAGEDEVMFLGCLENRDVVIGRGRLPLDALAEQEARVFMRLECRGRQVHAFCSADGRRWFTVGHTPFPEPLRIGVYAVGMVDSLVYPGVCPGETAIRFESLRFWGIRSLT